MLSEQIGETMFATRCGWDVQEDAHAGCAAAIASVEADSCEDSKAVLESAHKDTDVRSLQVRGTGKDQDTDEAEREEATTS